MEDSVAKCVDCNFIGTASKSRANTVSIVGNLRE